MDFDAAKQYKEKAICFRRLMFPVVDGSILPGPVDENSGKFEALYLQIHTGL